MCKANQAATKDSKPKFPLGHITATRGVYEHLERHGVNASEYLDRHVRGDWGDIPPEDAAAFVSSLSNNELLEEIDHAYEACQNSEKDSEEHISAFAPLITLCHEANTRGISRKILH